MRKALTVSLLLISILFGISWVSSNTAYATTAGFKAGEIMDDTVMTNVDSMKATDIQKFLDSKVPNCDTNG